MRIFPGLPKKWTALSLIVIAQSAGALIAQGTYVLIPFWKQQYGLSQASSGAFVTALSLGQLLALLLLGSLIDRWGEKKVLSLSLLALAAACLLVLIVPSHVETLIGTVFLWGLFYSAGQPGGTKAIIKWFPDRGRGLAIGLHQAAVPFGASLSAVLIPFTAEMKDWNWSVGILAIVSGLAGLAVLISYQDVGAELRHNKSTASAFSLKSLPANTYLLLVAGIAMTGVQFTFAAHGVLFIVERYRVDLLTAGSLFALTQVIAIPTRIFLPGIVENFWRRRIGQAVAFINLSGMAAIVGVGLLGPDNVSWIYVIAMLSLGFFTVGWYPVYLLQVTQLVSPSVAGRMLSLVTFSCMSSRIAGPPLFGLLVDLHGYDFAWACLLIPAALLTVPLIWTRFSAVIEKPASGVDHRTP